MKEIQGKQIFKKTKTSGETFNICNCGNEPKTTHNKEIQGI